MVTLPLVDWPLGGRNVSHNPHVTHMLRRCARNKPWSPVIPQLRGCSDCSKVQSYDWWMLRPIKSRLLSLTPQSHAGSTTEGETNSVRSPSLQRDLSWPFTPISLSPNLIFSLSVAKQTALLCHTRPHASASSRPHISRAPGAGRDYLAKQSAA